MNSALAHLAGPVSFEIDTDSFYLHLHSVGVIVSFEL